MRVAIKVNVTLDKKSRLDILKVAEFENGDEDEDGEGEVTWTRMNEDEEFIDVFLSRSNLPL